MMGKRNKFFRFVVTLLIFGLVLAGIHYLIIQILPESQRVDGVIVMHVFLFIITAVFYMGMVFLLNKKRQFMGYGFMAASLLKMMICILFLLPQIMNKQPDTKSYVFQFFGLYFLYLLFEVIQISSDLKKKPD